MVREWYLKNIRMLGKLFGTISYDDVKFYWIRIHQFRLPPVWGQRYSTLLIKTPGENIENYHDYNFYLNKDLSRMDGKRLDHIFERSGYNDLSQKNYARLSLHLSSFKPNLDVISGDNLVDVCQVVYNFLAQKKGI